MEGINTKYNESGQKIAEKEGLVIDQTKRVIFRILQPKTASGSLDLGLTNEFSFDNSQISC